MSYLEQAARFRNEIYIVPRMSQYAYCVMGICMNDVNFVEEDEQQEQLVATAVSTDYVDVHIC